MTYLICNKVVAIIFAPFYKTHTDLFYYYSFPGNSHSVAGRKKKAFCSLDVRLECESRAPSACVLCTVEKALHSEKEQTIR